MKPLNQKQKAKIRAFIRRYDRALLVPFPVIVTDVGCLRHNTQHRLALKSDSTVQHRQRRDELERLKSALEGLSYDTKAIITEFVGFAAMSVRGVHTWSGDDKDVDTISAAVDMALKALPNKKKSRGAGHMAEVRRAFVRDAAKIYLLAGFDTIGANDDSVLMAWFYLMDEVCSSGLADFGSFRRAIHAEIGKTQHERNAWKAIRIKWIKRTHRIE